MSKFIFYLGSALLGLLSVLFLAYSFLNLTVDPKVLKAVQNATESYQNGEKSESIADRKKAFNEALQGFLEAEKKANPSYGNGKLYYNIANSYYELGETPLAVYYYKRAQALMPRDDVVKQNLNIALSKLDLPPESSYSLLQSSLFFHNKLSLPERLDLFGILTLLLLILLSIYIWRPSAGLGFFATLLGLAVLLLCCSLLYSRFLAPQQGVLIQAAALYRDAGDQYAQVNDKPLSPGLTVEVLDVRDQGKWLKILPPVGTPGYVQQDTIKLL